MRTRVAGLIVTIVLVSSHLVGAGQVIVRAASVARIRIVHAVADAPSIDVYIDGRKWISRLAYKDFSDFITLEAKQHEFVVRPGGTKADATPLITKQIDLAANSWANVVALGLVGGQGATALDVVSLVGDRSATKGKGRVEFIDAIPDTALDGLNKDQVVFPNIAYGQALVMADLGQNIYNFTFAPTGATQPVTVTLNGYAVVADVIYTNVLVRTGDKIEVITMTTGELFAQIIHASPDAPVLDIYLNGEKSVGSLAFKGVSGLLTLRSRVYDVALRPAGAAPDTRPIYRRSLRLPAGQVSFLVVMGLLNGQSRDALRVFLTYPPPFLPTNRARLSVIHASPGGPLLDAAVEGKVVLRGVPFGNIGTSTVEKGTSDVTVLPFREAGPALVTVKGVAFEGDTQYYVLAVNTVDKIEGVLLASKSYVMLKRLARAQANPTAVPTK
jgi:Domain of unknown function (DUF4397)